MLGYENLQNHYKSNFALLQHHKYSLVELEQMIPWERYLYIDMLKAHIKEQEEKARDRAATIKAQRRATR